ncbi:MAG: CvpA family protein [Clostridia bacterium]|nr:CvpA family protein [Clostridia bacterium]
MSLLDIVIAAILGLFVLAGVYKGFVYTAIDILFYIICAVFALLLMPMVSGHVEKNETVYNAMLYYTEGSENIKDVEYRKKNITEISNAELEEIYMSSDAAYPMDERIRTNVEDAAFAANGVTSLGDYFNTTMVIVTINITVFMGLFIVMRAILGFVIGWWNYAKPLPVLKKFDLPAAIGAGFIRGVLAVFLIFMLCPIVLTVLPFDVVSDLVEKSKLASFFYYSNFLLRLIPGV